jgi:lycopene cyclase domain-containing protein
MSEYGYLIVLFASICGLVQIDRRWKLILWQDPKRALRVLAVMISFFVLWDIAGIATGIFFSGSSKYVTGIMLGPEFPVEEIFFLILLCYQSLILYELFRKRLV